MTKEWALEHCTTRSESDVAGDPYRGKVRDVALLNTDTLGIVVTDRISAVDHSMKQSIPYEGPILNRLSAFAFENTEDILPSQVLEVPHPNVAIAKKCHPIPIEIVMRGYLTGHAWREYKLGKRELRGVSLPGGMREHQKFPKPILTPATKGKE